MKFTFLAPLILVSAPFAQSFVPSCGQPRFRPSPLQAKYNSMDEILALFPDDKPILINFYDQATEASIKEDILRVKRLLTDRATVVSVKQQDYPEIAKVWDCAEKSPSMILFKDGNPVARLYEASSYLDVMTKFGPYCREEE